MGFLLVTLTLSQHGLHSMALLGLPQDMPLCRYAMPFYCNIHIAILGILGHGRSVPVPWSRYCKIPVHVVVSSGVSVGHWHWHWHTGTLSLGWELRLKDFRISRFHSRVKCNCWQGCLFCCGSCIFVWILSSSLRFPPTEASFLTCAMRLDFDTFPK